MQESSFGGSETAVNSARVFVDVFNDQIQHVAIDWKLAAAFFACLASPEMVW